LTGGRSEKNLSLVHLSRSREQRPSKGRIGTKHQQ
jgi:hypothetical protein